MTYYVCVENDKVIDVCNYQPNVPSSVSVVEITDQQYNQINNGERCFDPVKREVSFLPKELEDKVNSLKRKEESIKFLQSTDWKVLRHIRQKALGVPTSLTEEQYLELEQQRADAAGSL